MGYNSMIWLQLFAGPETSRGFTQQHLVVSKCVGDPSRLDRLKLLMSYFGWDVPDIVT
jgi:hypothetical protein